MTIIEQIKSRLSLADEVGERVKLRCSGKTLVGLCPFHDERTPSFHVYPEEQQYRCYGCQAHGDIIDFVARTRGIDKREAIAELAREAGIEHTAGDEQNLAPLYAANAEAAAFFAATLATDTEGQACRAYLAERGISEQTAQQFQLGYAPRKATALLAALARYNLVDVGIRVGLLKPPGYGGESPRAALWGRLTISIRDLRGRVIGFGARVLDAAQPKYINSPDSPIYQKSRVLYGIDTAAEAIRMEKSAVLVEGYFDAIALWQAGVRNVVATCGTALTVRQAMLLRRLAPEVVLSFDGDAAGQVAVTRSAETFLSAEVPARVALLPPPEDPDTFVRTHGAAAFRGLLARAQSLTEYVLSLLVSRPDQVSAVRDAARLLAACRDPAVRALLEKEIAQQFGLSAQAVHDLGAQPVGNGSTAPTAARTDPIGYWPKPEKIGAEPVPVPRLEPEMIPAALRPWLCDIAERFQAPLEYAAIPAIVAAGALIGRKIAVRPKAHDDWSEVANLWGIIVGRPGIMKSPLMADALKPIHRIERVAAREYKDRQQETEFKRKLAAMRGAALEEEIRKRLRSGKPTEELEAELTAISCGEEPVPRRYVVNDATVEKLGELLNQNANGLLVVRDELGALLARLDSEEHASERGFFLQAWGGKYGYIYDRVGRGTIRIEAASLSVIGGITPNRLDAYMRETFGGGNDDGLMQRYQLAVYPDPPTMWQNIDREPDRTAAERAYAVYGRLNSLIPRDVGACVPDAVDELPYLRLTPGALSMFAAWRETLERRIRTSDEHAAFLSHLAKYRGLCARLALIFHLIDAQAGAVSEDAMQRALDWCKFLEAHTRRVYQSALTPAETAAAALGKKLLANRLPQPFSARDVYRQAWTGLSARRDVEMALEVLEEAGWVKRVNQYQFGRPAARYLINPRVAQEGERDTFVSIVSTATRPSEPLEPLNPPTDKTDESPRTADSVAEAEIDRLATEDGWQGGGDSAERTGVPAPQDGNGNGVEI